MTAPHVYAQRLLKLAAFLETLPLDRFNFGRWVGDDWRGKPDLSCGTTACALGWATTMPEFRALGLVLRRSDGVSFGGGGVGGFAFPVLATTYLDEGADYWEATVEATAEVFGLDRDETIELFMPAEDYDCEDMPEKTWAEMLPKDSSASAVAYHIRRFVERKWGVS